MSVQFHARLQPRWDWCCVVLEGCGAVLIDLKQQINNFRYWEGKWSWQTTGQVVFGGWDQSCELVRFFQHTEAWPGLQAGFKAELHFCWVYSHAQKLNILSLKSVVSFQTWAVWALCPCSSCQPARAFRVDCHQQCHQLLFVTVVLTLRRAVLSVVFPIIKTLDSIGFPPDSSPGKVPNKVKEERYIIVFFPLWEF